MDWSVESRSATRETSAVTPSVSLLISGSFNCFRVAPDDNYARALRLEFCAVAKPMSLLPLVITGFFIFVISFHFV